MEVQLEWGEKEDDDVFVVARFSELDSVRIFLSYAISDMLSFWMVMLTLWHRVTKANFAFGPEDSKLVSQIWVSGENTGLFPKSFEYIVLQNGKEELN